MVAQGCTVDQVADEFRARWQFPPLAAYRYAAGLTQYQAASRYNEVVGDAAAGADNSLISKLELWPGGTGGKAPTAYNLVVLAVVYGTVPHRLVAPADMDKLARRDQLVLRAPYHQPSPHHSLATSEMPGTAVASVNGPNPVPASLDSALIEPIGLTPDAYDALSVDRLILAAADQSRSFAAWTESSELGSTAMEMYHSQLSVLARRFLSQRSDRKSVV